jgi:hypothetical protein
MYPRRQVRGAETDTLVLSIEPILQHSSAASTEALQQRLGLLKVKGNPCWVVSTKGADTCSGKICRS